MRKSNAWDKKIYGWEPLYLEAVLETDNQKLPERIARARAVINARYHSMPEDDMAERDAIANALAGLRSLHEERASGQEVMSGSRKSVHRAFGLAS